VRHEARAETPGGSIAYTRAGAGPALLLIHGLGGHRQTWNHVVDTLARTHTVIAPDLPGHGESDAPAGDYSLGAHAAALRDLLFALDVSSVTLVGHSLGGGVALQFAYQFPERASRLVLIGSGGLGPEVSWALRIASMTPGAGLILKGLAHVPARITATVLTAAAVLPGVMPRQDTGPLVATLRGLATASQRLAFRRTARSVIDWSGQTVSATGKLDALHELPLLLIWGGRDRVIPPTHHAGIAERISRSRCLEIPEAGHFPHESDPDLVLRAIGDFLRTTTRFEFSAERHREALRRTSATEQVQPGTSPS
jgi:pimeloyl-ACP methyl ester carboxylesterase